jgi:peptidoglycan hydrolase CwlO-like protein
MSARFSLARIAAALVAVVVAATLAMVPVQADTKKELNQAKDRLEELLGDIAGQQATVDRLQAEAGQLAAEISRVEARIADFQARILFKQEQIRDTEGQVRATQEQLDQRAWTAYESGPGDSLEFLLGSTSLSDLSTRLEIVDRAAQSDRELIDEMEALRERLRRRAGELQELLKEERGVRKEKLVQQEALVANLAAAQLVVISLNEDITEATNLVEKLKDKLAAEKLAAALARKSRGTSGGIGISGVFEVCPVDHPLGYSDDFGAPRVGHLHAGNDIFANEGTPVRAPFDGTAQDASSPEGLGGWAVKVFGSVGWVYNAHLTSPPHNLGAVSAGEIIGYVGHTGNAQGTPDHDHFEWHPNVTPKNPHVSPYGVGVLGDAIDPYPYLNAVC